MSNILNKQTAAGVLAALAMSAFYRWYSGSNLGT